VEVAPEVDEALTLAADPALHFAPPEGIHPGPCILDASYKMQELRPIEYVVVGMGICFKRLYRERKQVRAIRMVFGSIRIAFI
jgi:hypothetical protein